MRREGLLQTQIPQMLTLLPSRYLLGHPNPFVNKGKAILDISATCLTYLCSDALDPRLTDEEMKQNLVLGHYRLLNFATSQWADCVRLCVHFQKEVPSQLTALVEELRNCRANWDYDQDLETNLKFWGLLKSRAWPKAWEIVSRTLDFRRLLHGSYDWRLDEGSVSFDLETEEI